MTDQDDAARGCRAPTRTVRHRLLRGGGALLCAAGLGALFVAPAPTGVLVKDERFISAQTPGVLDIEGGECFDDPADRPEAGDVVVRYRPCAQTADNQSYGFVHAEDDGEWDPTALREFAWAGCRQLFVRTWPGDRGRELSFYPIMPTAETWADGDRDVMCVVYRQGRRLPGSVLPHW